MKPVARESQCPNCGFALFWTQDELLVGQTCGCCDYHVKPNEIDRAPPPIQVHWVQPEDVPTAFVARSDFQPEGVPVKIIRVPKEN